MKISIILPTHRTGYNAIARVLEAASLDPDKFEVIVRDNSDDEAKQRLLEQVRAPVLKVFHVPDLGAVENATEALALATGDFAFFLADDDWVSSKALLQLHDAASSNAADETIILLTGTYLVEVSAASGFVRYQGIESDDALERLQGYLGARGPNVLYYSVVKRSLLTFCLNFVSSLPYKFSFHDQLMVLLYVAAGRALQVQRVFYHYDQSEWETKEGTLAKDRAWYASAGLPIELDRLHWLICGLEGALTLNSARVLNLAARDRERLGGLWFASMFQRFNRWDRELGWTDTPTNEAARRFKQKWGMDREVNLHELLFDLCDVLETADKPGAQKYFEFWSSV